MPLKGSVQIRRPKTEKDIFRQKALKAIASKKYIEKNKSKLRESSKRNYQKRKREQTNQQVKKLAFKDKSRIEKPILQEKLFVRKVITFHTGGIPDGSIASNPLCR